MPESSELALEQTVEIKSVDDPVIVADSDSQAGLPNVTNVSAAISVQPDQLIGKVIAERYLIESYIGGGGMSHVYKARHLHIKDKIVALKLLQSQEFVDPRQVLRLQQEANAAGSLSHPNIIAVQDFGLAGPTQPYLVMDYFEGQSLDQLIKAEGTLSIDRLLGILGQICSALAHAHEMKVVHRDIKPSNIMVAQDEQGNDVVKVVDFGIAKRVESESSLSKLTQTGDILGSPLYMSPEQCLGQAVDGRSDIYSLGCVIYELVTREPAFAGDSVFETIYRHLNEAPAPFSASVGTDSRTRGLEANVLRMLAKLPAQRHQFMVELASELKKLESPVNPITGYFRRVWALWRARRSARARKAVAIESGLGVASVVALVVALLLFVLPEKVKQSSLEEARSQIIMTELNVSLATLMKDDSLLVEIFERQGVLAPTHSLKRERLVAGFQRLEFLCAGHSEQKKILGLLDESVLDSAAATLMFKESVLSRIRHTHGDGGIQRPNRAFADMMTFWFCTLAHSNTLLEKSTVLLDQSQKERIWCENIFELCKWLGLVLLLAIPSLLVLRWRNRK